MQIQGYTLFMGNRTKDKKTSVWNNNTQQTQSDKTEHKKIGNMQYKIFLIILLGLYQ